MSNPQNLALSFNGPEGQEDMPYLLTPGPVTTSRRVKLAMLADWGNDDGEFLPMLRETREELLRLAGCDETYSCVLLQGTGAFAMEATLGAFAPGLRKRKSTLVVGHGTASARALEILRRLDRKAHALDRGVSKAVEPAQLKRALTNGAISHVWISHCDSNTGLINPVPQLAYAAKAKERIVMVDATSTFGALDINMPRDNIDVLTGAVDACLESVPGASFVIAKKELLKAAKDQSHSVTLDLNAQWQELEKLGQFRFAPPTQVLAALREALRALVEEGGPESRLARYSRNADMLYDGLKGLGLKPLLEASKRGPLLQSWYSPKAKSFLHEAFAGRLRQLGFALSQGPGQPEGTFRVGTMGHFDETVMARFVEAVQTALSDLNAEA